MHTQKRAEETLKRREEERRAVPGMRDSTKIKVGAGCAPVRDRGGRREAIAIFTYKRGETSPWGVCVPWLTAGF
eukprot:6268520-Prymnesium_polylepis.1